MRKEYAGRNDRIFLMAAGLVVAAGLLFYLFSGRDDGGFAEITVDGELYGTYDLSKDQTVEIVIGETVTNTLQIKNHQADMIEADCPDQICVHQRPIDANGETIVCLPNKIVVEIKGAKAAQVDTVT